MFISFVATSTCIIVYRCGDYVENIQKMGRGIKVQYVCNADGGSLPCVPVVRSYTTLEMMRYYYYRRMDDVEEMKMLNRQPDNAEKIRVDGTARAHGMSSIIKIKALLYANGC